MNDKKITVRGTLCTLAGGILWGFSGTCGQYLFTTKAISPAWVTVVRMLASGFLLTLFCLLSKRQRAGLKAMLQNKKDRFMILAFGILGLMVSQYTYLTAIAYSNSGTATVLQYLGPVMIVILVCIRSMKLPTKKETLSILLALSGTFLLATHGNIHALAISPQGLFWGLASAVGLVLYTLIPRHIIKTYGSFGISGLGMLSGGFCLYFLTGFWQYQVVIDLQTMLATVAIIFLGTIGAYTLYLQGVKDIGPVKASLLACVEPVAATLFAVLWMKSQFGPIDILGFACILGTVFLLSKKT